MGDLKVNLKNARLAAGGLALSRSNNLTWQEGRQISAAAAALRAATDTFTAEYGGLATDVWQCQIQGIDPDNFEAYTPALVRMADGASGTRLEGVKRGQDDIKVCMIISPAGIDTIPRGAKLTTANGNSFIVTDTTNLSGSGTFRCWRASEEYGQLDFYGKPIYEPVCVLTPDATGTQPSGSEILVADHRIRCIMQRNSATASFTDNSRMLFDGIPYTAQGVTTTREITSRADTAHLYYFVLERDVLQPGDDVERGIPAGQGVTFALTITGSSTLTPGDTAPLTVTATRNGQTITSTEEHPLTYTWASSNENAATVDESGTVTAIAEGTATITATLEQNPAITASMDVIVEDTRQPELVWITPPPTTIGAYSSITCEAAYLDESGTATSDPVTYTVTCTVSGGMNYTTSGNKLTVTSYSWLYGTITITGAAHGLTLTATVYMD